MNCRLSSATPPHTPLRPGKWGSSKNHTLSEISCLLWAFIFTLLLFLGEHITLSYLVTTLFSSTTGAKMQKLPSKDTAPNFGERWADKVAEFGGSWTFIIVFTIMMIVWIGLNSWVLFFQPFDPYPYIFLNLVLSCIAALQAPIIMMSQNRQETKDRIRAEKDYHINLRAEHEIQQLRNCLNEYTISQQDSFNKLHEAIKEFKNHQKN